MVRYGPMGNRSPRKSREQFPEREAAPLKRSHLSERQAFRAMPGGPSVNYAISAKV